MCKRHQYLQADSGRRLSSLKCGSCGHLLIEDHDLGLHDPFTTSDLRIADRWLRALVSGQAGMVSTV